MRCHACVLDMQDPLGHVGSLVLVAYRLSTFTTSRFLSLGRSCQGLAMALMVGLGSHMAFTRTLPATSEYYSHCYDLLGSSARLVICNTAPASHSTDGLHKLVLKGDRAGKGPAMLVDAVQGLLRCLSS